MSTAASEAPRESRAQTLLSAAAAPWVVGGVVLLLTLGAAAFMSGLLAERDAARFENARLSARDRVFDRLEAYTAALRGVTALFAASQEVTWREFQEYVRRLEIQERFPGVQGIGYARRATPADVAQVMEETSRQLGRPVTLTPPGLRAEYFPVAFLEPPDARNRAAVGFDMYADSVRAEAMDRARDTGSAALSGKVRLVQEIDPDSVQAGFLIYLPSYGGGGTPGGEMRRAALRGFVYAPFRAADLFEGIFGTERPRVAFRVYDGTVPTPEGLLHASDSAATANPEEHAFADTLRLDVAGHAWTLTFVSLPELEGSSGRDFLLPAFVLLGIAMTGLLFILTRAQVEARARAERSEAQRARFFAAMSHELRTPINAVIGYNDLLLAAVYGDLAPAQQQGVERSQKSAKHLAELVNDVLDLSKIEAGKLTLEIEPSRMMDVVEDLLSTIRPLAEERGCELKLDVARCGKQVWTDPRRVRQILLNLLSNATKFGEGKPIEVRCADRHGGVAVEVTDHGPGIPPEHMHSIFEEFVQLEGPGQGTGLGLPISRRLAEMLGGTLEAESEVGRGSTFRLKLPRHAPQP